VTPEAQFALHLPLIRLHFTHRATTLRGPFPLVIDTRAFCLILAATGALAGCGDAERQQELALERRNEEQEISDESFFDLFRGRSDAEREVAVNRYLWQASLDVLSFLPVESADPFSGLLVTGWGNVGGSGAYRVTVFISDPSLDARALKVAGFRQAGGRAVPVGEAENRALEDAILTRARQMRIAQAGRQG
jgi:hypothetical protein